MISWNKDDFLDFLTFFDQGILGNQGTMGNKFLSLDVGTRLLKLAKSRKTLHQIVISGTSISSRLEFDIKCQCKANRVASAQETQQQAGVQQRITRQQFVEFKNWFDQLDKYKTGRVLLDDMATSSEARKSLDKSFLHILDDPYTTGEVNLLQFLMKFFPSISEEDMVFCMQCYSEYEFVEFTVPDTLTASQLDEIQTVFKRYDKNKNGFVSYNELLQGLSTSEIFISKETFKAAKLNKDGELSLESFVDVMTEYYTN